VIPQERIDEIARIYRLHATVARVGVEHGRPDADPATAQMWEDTAEALDSIAGLRAQVAEQAAEIERLWAALDERQRIDTEERRGRAEAKRERTMKRD
jgi:hypothetical protein